MIINKIGPTIVTNTLPDTKSLPRQLNILQKIHISLKKTNEIVTHLGDTVQNNWLN